MIKQAGIDDSKIVAELAMLLWPDNEISDLEKEMRNYISSDKRAVFIYFSETEPVGFAQCNLRSDYVEGTKSSPVGYLEGIFVKSEYRKRGIGKNFLFKVKIGLEVKGVVNLQVIVHLAIQKVYTFIYNLVLRKQIE